MWTRAQSPRVFPINSNQSYFINVVATDLWPVQLERFFSPGPYLQQCLKERNFPGGRSFLSSEYLCRRDLHFNGSPEKFE